jgi:hypothetical protein
VRVAKAQTLVIQQETVTSWVCTPTGKVFEADWKPILDSFKAANSNTRAVLPGYSLGQPYIVAVRRDIEKAWEPTPAEGPVYLSEFFSRRFPESGGGFIQVSAVGFDSGKTRAMVYMAYHCGALCGGGMHHLLEKVDGVWRRARIPDLSNCSWMS